MKKFKFTSVPLVCGVLLLFSCSKTNNGQELPGTELRSAFVRTLSFVNSDLVLDDMNSTFGVNLEVEDDANGDLLENIEVFAQFKSDNSASSNTSEVLIKTIPKQEFTTSVNGLPSTTLSVSLQELINATNSAAQFCGDQFLIRVKLNLSNGRSFSSDSGNVPAVIGSDTTINSPFCYTAHLVHAMPDDQYIGRYSYESLTDGPLGPTFGSPKIVVLQKGNSVNDRFFFGDYIASRSNEPSRKFSFIFSCDEVRFRKNQISSFFTWCPEGSLDGGFTFGGNPILLGPGVGKGGISETDDSYFDLSISEGYLGWNGECGFETTDVIVRFTKLE